MNDYIAAQFAEPTKYYYLIVVAITLTGYVLYLRLELERFFKLTLIFY